MIDWWKNTADMSSFLLGLFSVFHSKGIRNSFRCCWGDGLQLCPDWQTGSFSRIQMDWLTLLPKKVRLFFCSYSVLFGRGSHSLLCGHMCHISVCLIQKTLYIWLLFSSQVLMMMHIWFLALYFVTEHLDWLGSSPQKRWSCTLYSSITWSILAQ